MSGTIRCTSTGRTDCTCRCVWRGEDLGSWPAQCIDIPCRTASVQGMDTNALTAIVDCVDVMKAICFDMDKDHTMIVSNIK